MSTESVPNTESVPRAKKRSVVAIVRTTLERATHRAQHATPLRPPKQFLVTLPASPDEDAEWWSELDRTVRVSVDSSHFMVLEWAAFRASRVDAETGLVSEQAVPAGKVQVLHYGISRQQFPNCIATADSETAPLLQKLLARMMALHHTELVDMRDQTGATLGRPLKATSPQLAPST